VKGGCKRADGRWKPFFLPVPMNIGMKKPIFHRGMRYLMKGTVLDAIAQ